MRFNEYVNRIKVAEHKIPQRTLLKAALYFRIPWNVWDFNRSWTVNFSDNPLLHGVTCANVETEASSLNAYSLAIAWYFM